jgi:hypothetical protein
MNHVGLEGVKPLHRSKERLRDDAKIDDLYTSIAWKA